MGMFALPFVLGGGASATAAGIGGAALGIGGAAALKKTLSPKIPNMPSAPTIDEAAKMVQETDRIRRRKGVAANIYAGAATAPAAAGGKQTLGG